jgi:hypothetical protein
LSGVYTQLTVRENSKPLPVCASTVKGVPGCERFWL